LNLLGAEVGFADTQLPNDTKLVDDLRLRNIVHPSTGM
jgi:hypothetical protein